MTRKRILSGIQPTGSLHLGNYLGAIKHWVDNQEDRENFICIVDLHAVTLYQEPEVLCRQTRELAALLLAAGIDPQRTTLFVQSHVRAHAEASWFLTCVTPLGWLERMTQFKDKARRQEGKQEMVLTGLLTYPVLQAADILLYDADEVPVGEDQKQHVELARDIAQRFNSLYGETFKLPQPAIPPVAARVMGLDDPTQKMSKSSTAQGHAVRLTDEDEQILRAFKRSVTDSGREIAFSDDPAKAGVNNLLGIYRGLTGKSEREVLADFAGARGYGDLKQAVGERVVATFAPIRAHYRELMADPAQIDRLLAAGAERAGAQAERRLLAAKRAMGFLLP
jgi:tryptophanyl-tRNA synthetase